MFTMDFDHISARVFQLLVFWASGVWKDSYAPYLQSINLSVSSTEIESFACNKEMEISASIYSQEK